MGKINIKKDLPKIGFEGKEESKYCKCTPDETTGWIQEVGGVPECNICGKQVKIH